MIQYLRLLTVTIQYSISALVIRAISPGPSSILAHANARFPFRRSSRARNEPDQNNIWILLAHAAKTSLHAKPISSELIGCRPLPKLHKEIRYNCNIHPYVRNGPASRCYQSYFLPATLGESLSCLSSFSSIGGSRKRRSRFFFSRYLAITFEPSSSATECGSLIISAGLLRPASSENRLPRAAQVSISGTPTGPKSMSSESMPF